MRRPVTATVFFIVLTTSVALNAQDRAPTESLRVRVSVDGHLSDADLLGLAGVSRDRAVVYRDGATLVVKDAAGVVTVFARPGTRLVGIAASHEDDRGFAIRDAEGVLVWVPRRAASRIERSVGRRSRWRNAGFGALIGLVGGGLFGLTVGSDCRPGPGSFGSFDCFMEPQASALGGAILGAGGGAVVGAVIRPAEKWRPLVSWP